MAPQSKKLTDCPENLREAIDWLIQVRHGGDGKGLEKLANALKKLIDEAIKDARESLDDRKEQLECPGKYWEPESYCNKKDKAIEGKRKEIEEAKENSDKTKLKSELTKFESEKEKHYTEDHYLSADARKKAFNEITDRQNQLTELSKKLGDFTDSTKCKELLKNLCTGLETFLGFNSDSKGYTGSGIVYSDLDRLCDGVMGFLHGVLESVKDDDGVKTYDDYIGDENHKLNKILRVLKSAIGKGSGEFGAQVTSVSGWLERYNEEVNKKTDALSGKLCTLKKQVESHLVQFRREDPKDHKSRKTKDELNKIFTVRNVKSIVSGCMLIAETCMKEIFDNDDSGMQALDPDLQAKFCEPLNRIKMEVVRFAGSSKKDEMQLETMKNTVTSALNALRESVHNRIGYEVAILVDKLKFKVENMKTKLEYIDTAMQHFVKKLNKWMQEALTFIEDAVNKLKKILGEVDLHKNPSNKNAVEGAAAWISAKAEELHGKFEELNTTYTGVITTIKGKNGEGTTEGVVYELSEVQSKVQEPEILEKWKEEGNGNLWNLKTQIEKLITQIESNVGAHVQSLASDMKEAVSAATNSNPVDGNYLGLNAMQANGLGKLPSFGARISVAALDPDTIGPGANLEKILYNLNNVANNWTAASVQPLQIYHEVVKGIGESIGKEASKVDAQLLALLRSAAITGEDNLQKEITKIVHKKLQPIKNEASELVSHAQAAKDAILLRAKEVTTSLKLLCDAATSDAYYINSHLGDLKEKIGIPDKGQVAKENTLQEICNKVHELQNGPVTKALNFATNFPEEAKRFQQDCINDLSSFVNKKFQDVILTIIDQAEKQYVDSRVHALGIFNNVVQKQYGKMVLAKDFDKSNGIKGMLGKLQEQFLPAIMKIEHNADPKPTLEDAAKHIQEGFGNLFDKFCQQDEIKPCIDNVKKIVDSLQNLLLQIQYFCHFHYDVSVAGHDFQNVLAAFITDMCSYTPKAGLLPLESGLLNFTEQLGHAYVNRYSGKQFEGQLWTTKQVDDPEKSDGAKKDITDLTPEGRNCAKVCLTIVEMVMKNFVELKAECTSCNDKTIHLGQIDMKTKNGSERIKNPLGAFFADRGYKVATDSSKQDGEVQNEKKVMTGSHIMGLCEQKVIGKQTALFAANNTGILKDLYTYLKQYYKVRHLEHIPSPKQPCNIYQMLQWLCGIQYYPSMTALYLCFKDLFPRDEEYKGKDIKVIPSDKVKLSATAEITYAQLATRVFVNVSLCSHDVLVAILGYGHEGGRYAVDFHTNEEKLSYPSNPSQSLDLLVEISLRVFHQSRFLYEQCRNSTTLSGWSDCWYGQRVGGSEWQCNTMQCANQECKLSFNQKADQTCDRHPICGLKSPLQSFLEDGLQGFLPHPYNKADCKISCSLANHKGIPCKTPMGFRDLSRAASHTQRGERLGKTLEDFCGDGSYLRLLCSAFNCLLCRPPQTLGDMFAFYQTFFYKWSGYAVHKKDAFAAAVSDANFGDTETKLDPTVIFGSGDHNKHIAKKHHTGDLFSLVSCEPESNAVHPCGQYIQSLDYDTRFVHSKEYADKYLSWIVYITESFYDLLKKMYEECNSRCGGDKPKCRIAKCPSICAVAKQEKNCKHTDSCKSIVQCPSTLPTLCKYGFYYGNTTELYGQSSNTSTKRTCKDFCSLLESILNKEEKVGTALAKLIHVTIPEFLWEIRGKFFWTTVALWSLSLFYLLHIMVIRLDLLHIKSHLHSPSSHRIAAQSLLAAARVGKLAKITYLQP